MDYKKCPLCSGSKKVLLNSNGSLEPYLPALAMDSHHRGKIVIYCPECLEKENEI